jgi:hypothetical protein
MCLQHGAAFKGRDGIVKRDIAAFKRGYDPLQFTERILKADSGTEFRRGLK